MRRAAARLALAVGLLGAATPAAATLRVVATSTDLAALVEAVGGRSVEVTSLAPPLADPHAVELKPAHLQRLRQADLLVRIGLDHEPWLAKAVAASGNARIRRGAPGDVDASRGIALLQAETPRLRADARPHSHGLGNPHYWLDPRNARPITAAILEALSAASARERATFADNRARFLGRLEAALPRWRESLAPWKGARVVVVHETWTYFAAAFDLAIVAAVEPAPGVPPTPSELAALVARMRSGRVRLVIADPHSDPALLARIAAASGSRVVTLAPSVGADAEATDYLALFEVNVRRVAAALAG